MTRKTASCGRTHSSVRCLQMRWSMTAPILVEMRRSLLRPIQPRHTLHRLRHRSRGRVRIRSAPLPPPHGPPLPVRLHLWRCGPQHRTRYGSVRMSPKSYFVHHTQQLSKAAVVGEGASIRRRIDVLKQKACRAVAADAAASEGYTA